MLKIINIKQHNIKFYDKCAIFLEEVQIKCCHNYFQVNILVITNAGICYEINIYTQINIAPDADIIQHFHNFTQWTPLRDVQNDHHLEMRG